MHSEAAAHLLPFGHFDSRAYATEATKTAPKTYRTRHLNFSKRQYEPKTRQLPQLKGKSLDEIIEIYDGLTPSQKSNLSDKNFFDLINSLRTRINLEKFKPEQQRDRSISERGLALGERIALDLRNSRLSNVGPDAFVLLTLFTETHTWDAGIKFWAWLREQNDIRASAKAYSIAIRMLAAQDTDLAEIESVYQEALTRSHANFVTYHFSPPSVLPDRTQEHLSGIDELPTSLLSSIIIARLQRGDTKNAYLALDTLLRLKPRGAALAKDLSEILPERPLTEAWALFSMMCRTKVGPANLAFRAMISLVKPTVNLVDRDRHVWVIRAMLSAAYMQAGGGGVLVNNVISEILIAITQIMRLDGASDLPADQRELLASAVHEVYESMSVLFVKLGVTPSLSVYHSAIVNFAGQGRQKEFMTLALEHAKALGYKPTIVTHRSVITAAGQLQDSDTIASGWKSLVEERARLNQYPDATDAHILTKAALLANKPELARAMLAEMTHLDTAEVDRVVSRIVESEEKREIEAIPSRALVEDILTHVGKLNDDVQVFREYIDAGESADQLAIAGKLPMTLTRIPDEIVLPEAEMQRLYDELTTDATSLPTTPVVAPVLLEPSASVPIATLRYENWKTMNYLLAISQRSDAAYNAAVDEAIAMGRRPPTRAETSALGEFKGVPVGLSDFKHGGGVAQGIVGDEVLDELNGGLNFGARQRILELRRTGD
ncbi:hypothetical protein B0A48_03361 [Cryoendolithus antarcticus]|uniref:Pentacotripeptide-repeat region of PRORP domain-containing protein n=1 Tax=Cryoendolithus antarcticus TaxID=1507870 RepID=A0A1V8TK03_9PEZI|nr:hypothetical protein B0A48_03361 [Cryoendolithus antarcticus]